MARLINPSSSSLAQPVLLMAVGPGSCTACLIKHLLNGVVTQLKKAVLEGNGARDDVAVVQLVGMAERYVEC